MSFTGLGVDIDGLTCIPGIDDFDLPHRASFSIPKARLNCPSWNKCDSASDGLHHRKFGMCDQLFGRFEEGERRGSGNEAQYHRKHTHMTVIARHVLFLTCFSMQRD